MHGALPRIEVDPQRRKNTSIALEEVKRGLVPFANIHNEQKEDDNVIPLKLDE